MKDVSDRVLTVPNVLTLVRLLTIPVVVLLLLETEDVSAAGLLVLAAVTDFLDGWIARRWRGSGQSHLGRVLDPLADRLLLSSVAVVLVIRGFLPGFVVAMLVGRDVLALAGSLVFRGKIRVNKVGKAATAALMAAIVVIIYKPGVVGEIMFYSGLGLSLGAGVLYIAAVKKTLSGREAGEERRSRR